MVTKAAPDKNRKSEDQILDEAAMRLLRAVKEHEKTKGTQTTEDQLRKEGYSERFIDKVRRA